jgi:hypothetical protein
VIAVPLHLASVSSQQEKEIVSIDWYDTRIVLPGEAPAGYAHLFSEIKGNHEKKLL